ncbi:MAG: hypothetical protein K6E98_01135 [Lachnospiraceae bacterium]|nr:hypothetical protein [Lachnospiraceae bacterium]
MGSKRYVRSLSVFTASIILSLSFFESVSAADISEGINFETIIEEGILIGDEGVSENEILSVGVISDNEIREEDILVTEEGSAEHDPLEHDIIDEGPAEEIVSSEENMMGDMPVVDPIEVENPSYDKDELFICSDAKGLPSKYVPTDLPKLRCQNPYNTCWAFSSMSMAEMSLIRKGRVSEPDLSELHLSYFTYNTVADPLGGTDGDINKNIGYNFLSRGGSVEFTKNILANWTGAADEVKAPYNSESIASALDEGIDSSLAYCDVAHLTDYYEVNLSNTVKDENTGEYTKSIDEDGIRAIKELIYSNGAAGISFYSKSNKSSYYSSENNCYYDPEVNTNTNHAVTIVGWDDEFSKDKFVTAPEGDGAWLIRNSWTDGGNYEDDQNYSGYFWLSYYNKNTRDKALACVFDTEDNYDNNYQYDGGMYTSYTKATKAANVFTAHALGETEGYENVKAAAFYTNSAQVDYRIDIYTSLEDEADPQSGILESTTEGTTVYAGYHTIPLSDIVKVEEDELFSVVVTLSNDSDDAYIGVEKSQDASWYKITTSALEGQSFVDTGSGWKDYGKAQSQNVKIKAFTDSVVNTEVYKSVYIEFEDGEQGEKFREYDYTGSPIKPQIKVYYRNKKLSEGKDYTLSYKNNINAYTQESADIIGKSDPVIIVKGRGDYSMTVSVNFSIRKVNIYDYYSSGKITANLQTAPVKKNKKGIYSLQKLKPDIYLGNKKLTAGRDYALSYEDERENAYAGPSTVSDPWNITVNAKGNNLEGSFVVGEILCESEKCISLKDRSVSVLLSENKIAYGNENPGYKLIYTDRESKKKTELVENRDYTVSVINSGKIGTAKYIFTSTGGDNDLNIRFTGNVSKNFTINKANLLKDGKCSIELSGADEENAFDYIKEGVKPEVKVTYNGKDLVLGRDYKLTYGNYNVIRKKDAKKAPYVKVTGIGSYSGSVFEKYTVNMQDISELEEPVVADVFYSKKKNAYKKTTIVLIDVNGKRLIQGKDFIISEYSAQSDVPDAGTVVRAKIEGKNCYKGSQDVEYSVLSAKLNASSITYYADSELKDKVTYFEYTGNAIKPQNIKIKVGRTELVKGKDYEIAGYYNNINKGTGNIVIKGLGNYAGVKIFNFRIKSREISLWHLWNLFKL